MCIAFVFDYVALVFKQGWELQLSLGFDSQLSSTLMHSRPLWSGSNLMRVDESFRYARGNISSQLSCNSCSGWLGHESWENLMQTLASQLSSTHMQLLFSFDHEDMRVEKTLMQTLASQLSCNSCSRLTRAWELRKLSCKLSLLNSHATLVLVWPGHESWENSHANSCFSTLMQLLFSFDQGMRVEKTLMQTLASQLSWTLILVWPRLNNISPPQRGVAIHAY